MAECVMSKMTAYTGEAGLDKHEPERQQIDEPHYLN